MAFTASDLAAIERAIASGELVVQYADKRIEYRSVAQLRQAREMIRGELAAASSEIVRGGTTLAVFSRE